jgi:hypothetical protein
MKELRKMDRNCMTSRPKRRDDGLIVRQLEREVIVYDLERHEAHCLNPEAARLWNACDGNRDEWEILHLVYGDLPGQGHEAALLFGLQQLREKHLMEGDTAGATPESAAHISRRDIFVRYGKVAAVTVALPAVMSIVSPTPAEAASCLASGASCSSSSQCCSGLCLGGGICA